MPFDDDGDEVRFTPPKVTARLVCEKVGDDGLTTSQRRIAELETALREIAEGHIDPLGNRRNHFRATSIAREALGLTDR